jgi:DNA-directed RNA polymerase subunit RPC12/RpoP
MKEIKLVSDRLKTVQQDRKELLAKKKKKEKFLREIQKKRSALWDITLFRAIREAYRTFTDEIDYRRQLPKLTELFEDSVAMKPEYDYRTQLIIRDERTILPKSLLKELYRYIANSDSYYDKADRLCLQCGRSLSDEELAILRCKKCGCIFTKKEGKLEIVEVSHSYSEIEAILRDGDISQKAVPADATAVAKSDVIEHQQGMPSDPIQIQGTTNETIKSVWEKKKWSERFKDAFGHWAFGNNVSPGTKMEDLPFWNDMLTFLDKEAEVRASDIKFQEQRKDLENIAEDKKRSEFVKIECSRCRKEFNDRIQEIQKAEDGKMVCHECWELPVVSVKLTEGTTRGSMKHFDNGDSPLNPPSGPPSPQA